MTKLRILPLAALGAALLLPSGGLFAQDESPQASAAPAATLPLDDARLSELRALFPPALAGLPLDDNLQLATGEQLASVMSEEESAVLGELLATHGVTLADYAAATTFLPISETDIVVIQAHRIAAVPASETIEAWVEILTGNMTEPQVSDGFVGGRAVTLVSDAATPEVPLLHLIPADDVMWMMVAADQALVESFLDSVAADRAGPGGTAEGGDGQG